MIYKKGKQRERDAVNLLTYSLTTLQIMFTEASCQEDHA
jgi:hypothetical protein